jgi:hypothetical protein
VEQLNAYGLSSADIPAKIECLSFGPDVTVDDVVKHTLFVSNDNNFEAQAVSGATLLNIAAFSGG